MRTLGLGVALALSYLGSVGPSRAETAPAAIPDAPEGSPGSAAPSENADAVPAWPSSELAPEGPLPAPVGKGATKTTPTSTSTPAPASPVAAGALPPAIPPSASATASSQAAASSAPNANPGPGSASYKLFPPRSAPAVATPSQTNSLEISSDSDKEPDEFLPFTQAFGIEGGLGANGRIDGGPSGFASKDRFDMALSLGAWAEPNRKWAYGVEYARTGLGGARTLPTPNSATVAYDLNTLWAKARYFPWRNPKFRGFAGLGLGLSIEEVRANGTRESAMPFNVPPQVYACTATSHPTVSLGAALGGDVDLEKHLAFLFQIEAAAQPITGDVVGDCAVASGSVLNAVARLGFAYKFDATDSFIDDQTR